jgi:hypothetical protein
MIGRLLICGCLLLSGGCAYFPTLARQSVVHNPLPQLSRVAVAPFFNHSAEPLPDLEERFGMAYFAELQNVPGFIVVPPTRVTRAMQEFGITLASPQDVRKLAQILDVDAVVIGAITDYTPYYPPRVGLQVEWYAANPNFHPIPPGYGLPWGTPEEENIPPALIFEARMALAREQMKTQEPPYQVPVYAPIPEPPLETSKDPKSPIKVVSHETPAKPTSQPVPPSAVGIAAPIVADATTATGLPPDWPDPRGFTPPPPAATRPVGIASNEPVMRHTRSFNGADAHVTEALATYVYFRDDARFGGWQSYLQRSEDYIRFCCHAHIAEMLTARGGAGETRVVWRWPINR